MLVITTFPKALWVGNLLVCWCQGNSSVTVMLLCMLMAIQQHKAPARLLLCPSHPAGLRGTGAVSVSVSDAWACVL